MMGNKSDDESGCFPTSGLYGTWRLSLLLLVAQSCLTLCDPVDCSPPGCSVHGTLQAGMLEWVPMPSSRGSSRPRDRSRVSRLLRWQAGSLPPVPPGKPCVHMRDSKVKKDTDLF